MDLTEGETTEAEDIPDGTTIPIEERSKAKNIFATCVLACLSCPFLCALMTCNELSCGAYAGGCTDGTSTCAAFKCLFTWDCCCPRKEEEEEWYGVSLISLM